MSFYTEIPELDQRLSHLFSIQCANEINITTSQRKESYELVPDIAVDLNKRSIDLRDHIGSLIEEIHEDAKLWPRVLSNKGKVELKEKWDKRIENFEKRVHMINRTLMNAGLVAIMGEGD